MNHVPDSQLLAHLQGRLAPPDAAQLLAHLRQCVPCQQRLTALESVWGHLATWTPAPPPLDLESRILASLPGRPAVEKGSAWLGSLRVAAALLLAAGIGHAVGRMAWRPADSPPVDAEAATAALHLDDESSAQTLLAALDAPEGVHP